MGEEVKKISFGFSKLTKKTQIVSSSLNQIKSEKSNVELIDCFEGKAIKLKNPVQPVDKILVIPLQRQQEIKLEIKSEDDSKNLTNDAETVDGIQSKIKVEPNNSVENVSLGDKNSESGLDLKPAITSILTLDEIAAKEILEDLKDKKKQDESRIFTVPLTNNPPAGENESSLEDYENIPVGDFGLAMLRGMGWAPGKGIGKNEKLVSPSLPALRPKGMGLGADKVLKPSLETKATNEDLKMVKNSFIRVIAGQHKDSYGQIEGFDDETGRLFVKLAMKNVCVSLNEFMVQLVDKDDYSKNSKVINVSKYEQYKNDENKKKQSEKPEEDNKKQSVIKPNSVDGFGKQHKLSRRPGDNSTETKKGDSDSTEKIPMGRETVGNKCVGLDRPRKSHRPKHSKGHSRSRSSSSSSSDVGVRPPLKMSKESYSKRARSSSSSSDSYKRNKSLPKSKHRPTDSDKRSYHKAKSSRDKKNRSRSSSSSYSSASSDYDKKSKCRTGKKMSSSREYKSKNRPKSPRERESSKHHKHKYRR